MCAFHLQSTKYGTMPRVYAQNGAKLTQFSQIFNSGTLFLPYLTKMDKHNQKKENKKHFSTHNTIYLK